MMGDDHNNGLDDRRSRIERSVERCLEWTRLGRHQKVITEVDRVLPDVEDHSHFTAILLIWKAQAHLAMGCAERALPAASKSWELEPSPHACHLQSNALEAVGDLEGTEELLRMGWRLFPDAVHLPVQLAVVLSEQARLPEALDILEELPFDDQIPEDLRVFLFGMRSNLLAAMGRWAEADEVLRDGLGNHPNSRLLGEAHDALRGARRRSDAEKNLAASWREGLRPIEGVEREVDDAIIRCCAVNELSELVCLAARRLWRAYLDDRDARPQAPDPWGAAAILATLEIDGQQPSIVGMARSVGTNVSSTRRVLKRFRTFVASLDHEFKTRAFAAHTNPRLDGPSSSVHRDHRPANVLPFPNT
jgi:tetratricopeptide (TPR) repeat protein